MDMYQFYPTPKELGERLWSMFENQHFVRVLEGQAGNGDLALLAPEDKWGRKRVRVDCCEIDVTRHPALREHGFEVVGTDFLAFSSGAIYSHFVMNPPFAQGAKHVLKAWDIGWDCEIAAILNAETIRNAFSAERQRLAKLIAEHGRVEFAEGAFMTDETERKTNVEVALVYLRKTANTNAILGDLYAELNRDETREENVVTGYGELHEVALPNSDVENRVLAFNAAVHSMREAVIAQARASHYERMLGGTMAEISAGTNSHRTMEDPTVSYVRAESYSRYVQLKDRAWAGILTTTKLREKLSSQAQRRLESEFESIKKLEFTTANVYGFLSALVSSSGKIQSEMACDVFETISAYHSDNTFFYRGWKSNDRHRSCGRRIKATRFILPGHSTESYQNGLRYESLQLLRDFDKVFAMVDGKLQPEIGLVEVFERNFRALRLGARVSSTYFDVRYYPGVGTIHFFPRNQEVVDKLNRLVGKLRRWLPPEGTPIADDFWTQYDKAGKFDTEVRKELAKASRTLPWYKQPLEVICRTNADGKEEAHTMLDAALKEVQMRHNIDADRLIENKGQQTLLLAA